jgi:hypothetical protein
MDAKLVADAETLRQTAERLARVGLIVDRTCLSPEQRRAAFALECRASTVSKSALPQRGPIGFAYPNAR